MVGDRIFQHHIYFLLYAMLVFSTFLVIREGVVISVYTMSSCYKYIVVTNSLSAANNLHRYSNYVPFMSV